MVDGLSGDDLVREYGALVSRCVRPFLRTDEPREDLIQIGYIALLEAAQRYDRRKGAAFATYAMWRIRGALLHHFRDHAWPIPVPRRQFQEGARVRTLSLDADLDSTHPISETLGADDPALAAIEARETLRARLRTLPRRTLPRRTRHVLLLSLVMGLSQDEIARRLGISQKSVSRILCRLGLARWRRSAKRC